MYEEKSNQVELKEVLERRRKRLESPDSDYSDDEDEELKKRDQKKLKLQNEHAKDSRNQGSSSASSSDSSSSPAESEGEIDVVIGEEDDENREEAAAQETVVALATIDAQETTEDGPDESKDEKPSAENTKSRFSPDIGTWDQEEDAANTPEQPPLTDIFEENTSDEDGATFSPDEEDTKIPTEAQSEPTETRVDTPHPRLHTRNLGNAALPPLNLPTEEEPTNSTQAAPEHVTGCIEVPVPFAGRLVDYSDSE